MELKEIKELIALMKKNDLSVFKMEREGFKIVLKKGGEYQPVYSSAPTQPSAAAAPSLPASSAPPATAAPAAGEAAPKGNFREITSPMVGTFYQSASPDSPAYVEAGTEITEDSVVCIIEAMKVMNEIKAEIRGTVVEVLVENGKPVQFGQPLFKVK